MQEVEISAVPLERLAAILSSDRAERLGAAAGRVRSEYLGDRHLAQYAELFTQLVSSE